MTEQEKTFIAKEFDKLENQLDSKYALYENGYQSALFDALEVVNKLPIHNVGQQRELLYFFAKDWNENQTTAETAINSDDIKNCIEKYNCG